MRQEVRAKPIFIKTLNIILVYKKPRKSYKIKILLLPTYVFTYVICMDKRVLETFFLSGYRSLITATARNLAICVRRYQSLCATTTEKFSYQTDFLSLFADSVYRHTTAGSMYTFLDCSRLSRTYIYCNFTYTILIVKLHCNSIERN